MRSHAKENKLPRCRVYPLFIPRAIIGRGVILQREVEIRRGQGSKGEETDMLVSSFFLGRSVPVDLAPVCNPNDDDHQYPIIDFIYDPIFSDPGTVSVLSP